MRVCCSKLSLPIESCLFVCVRDRTHNLNKLQMSSEKKVTRQTTELHEAKNSEVKGRMLFGIKIRSYEVVDKDI